MASLTGVVDELRDAAWELDAAVSRSGLVGRITSGYRSRSDQTRLHRAYLAGRTAFPVAAPGFSAHEYGEAFDYVVSPYEYQSDVGAYWVSMGGEWGGAGDMVHFELPGASERARAAGLASQEESFGARVSGGITTAIDFYGGSSVAALVSLIPGLSENRALEVLSQPFESFQKWLISSIRIPTLRK